MCTPSNSFVPLTQIMGQLLAALGRARAAALAARSRRAHAARIHAAVVVDAGVGRARIDGAEIGVAGAGIRAVAQRRADVGRRGAVGDVGAELADALVVADVAGVPALREWSDRHV